MVFISGFIFLLLSLFRFRKALIDALSPSMRCGIAVGIGLFITFIGLNNGGIVIPKAGTIVSLNVDLLTPGPIVFMTGLLVMQCFTPAAYRVRS